MIRQVSNGFMVVSESGKKLSRIYSSRKEAEKRLAEIEYFKAKGKK